VSAESLLRQTFQISGTEYLKVCFDFTAYSVGSAFERAPGLVHFYQRGLELIGNHVRFYETETSGGAIPLDEEALELVPFWFTGTTSRRSIYYLSLESGSAPNVPSDRGFLLRAWEATSPPVGCVRLVMPVTYPDIVGARAVGVFADLVSELKYASGHAGFAVNWNETGDYGIYAQQVMGVLAQRHPGLDLPDTTATLMALPNGFKRVNWLTLLNAEYCERLGGLAQLRAALGPRITVHELPDGVIIQAGPRPDIGDVNRGRWLPLYHQVGTVLEPLRARPHPGFLARGQHLGDEDFTDDWLGHFDAWPPDHDREDGSGQTEPWRSAGEGEPT
jgi:hypothetical protein